MLELGILSGLSLWLILALRACVRHQAACGGCSGCGGCKDCGTCGRRRQ